MTQMVKGYNELISIRIGDNIITMTIVEKQNQSGFKFNERLLILVHFQFLGYISKVKMNETAQSINADEAKVKIPIKHLFTSEVEQNILKLKFTSIEEGKLVPKQWILRFTTEKLAELWKQLIQYQIKEHKKLKSSPQKTRNQPNKKKQKPKVEEIRQIKKTEQKPKPEVIQTPIKPAGLTPKKDTVIIEGSKVQASGTFDQDLFGDDSDEQIKKRPRKVSKSYSPPQPEQTPPKPYHQVDPLSPSISNYQAESPPEQKTSQQVENSRRVSRVKLSLPQIQQEQIQQHQDQKSSKHIRSKMQNLKRQPSEVELKQTSEQIEIDTINQLTKNMKEKNQKFPINQITHDSKQAQQFFKLFKNKLPESKNPKQSERIIDAVLDRMRSGRQFRTISADLGNKEADWVYRQLTQPEAPLIIQFRQHCSALMKQIVLELHNKRFNKVQLVCQNEDFIQLTCKDIDIKIPLITADQSNKLNLQNIKSVQNQFKSFKHLYSLIENRGIIRSPLVCLCEFGGFMGFFKVKAMYYTKEYEDRYQQLVDQVSKLQTISCLPLKHLVDSGAIKPLNLFHYNEMRKGETTSEFKFYFIDSVEGIFPYDVTDKIQRNTVLRVQLVEQEINNTVLPYRDIFDTSTTGRKMYPELNQLATKLNSKIDIISSSISSLQFQFISSKQLSSFIHKEGVNMKYLGLVYRRTYDQFAKCLLASEIIARTGKKFMFKALQDSCRQDNHIINSIEELEQLLMNRINDFLNCLLGTGHQSEELYHMIIFNAEQYYQVNVERNRDKKQILSPGQLLVSLAYNCFLEVNWKSVQTKDIFITSNPLKKEDVWIQRVGVKSIKPHKNNDVCKLTELLSKQTHQNFKTIVEDWHLKEEKIPAELALFDLEDTLRLYLANFIDPDQLDWTNSFSHLSLFATDSPSSTNFKIDLKAIQYYLQKGNKFKYLSKFNDFSNRIQKIYGNNHPLLSDLYQLFATFHQSKGEVEDALSFMKSSVLNLSAMSGDYNQLIPQKFYSIYKLLVANERQKEAQQYLAKTMRILESYFQLFGRKVKVSLYGQVKLQMARKLFTEGSYSSALTDLEYANEVFDSYQKGDHIFEEERVNAYQMMHTCYIKLNRREDMTRLSCFLEPKLNKLQNHQHFQEVVWIIVQSSLYNLQGQGKHSFFKLVNKIPIKRSIRYYKTSLQMLKRRSNQNSLRAQLIAYGNNSKSLLHKIQSSNILSTWSNLSKVYQRQSYEDFVALIQELIYMFGKDRLNTIHPSM